MAGGGGRRPGVVNWLARLVREKALGPGNLRFITVSAKYADKDFFIDDVFTDHMAFSAAMLSEKGDRWVSAVMEQIDTSKALVDQLAYLAKSIAKAAGDADGDHQRDAARETAYYLLDMPFREWLEGIDGENDGQEQAKRRWWTVAQGIVRGIGRDLIAGAGPKALVGRKYTENKKERLYCAPDAYNGFLYKTASPGALITGGKQNG